LQTYAVRLLINLPQEFEDGLLCSRNGL
jgi:hypothetical protein